MLPVSASVVVMTVAIVGAGLRAIGTAFEMAVALAAIATATDPAAIEDVVKQCRAKGPFMDILLGIAAADDA